MGVKVWRRGLFIMILLMVAAAVPIGVAQASQSLPRAGSGALKLSGPKTNKVNASFTYTISGTAKGAANYLVAWEQYYPQSGCASTDAAESTRTFLPTTYGLTLFLNESVSHKFSTSQTFAAIHPGKHGMCAYLIDLSTGNTYAYAGAFWING